MADLKTITDTVHGTIRLDPLTLDLLETLELQRLNSIRQLGLTYLVFPGANHSRVEHCLGVGHVAGEMARALGLPDDERKLVQAAGLLHDVGHGPFSHTLEHVLSRELAVDHMHLTQRIITGHDDNVSPEDRRAFPDVKRIHEVLETHRVDPEAVAALIRGPRKRARVCSCRGVGRKPSGTWRRSSTARWTRTRSTTSCGTRTTPARPTGRSTSPGSCKRCGPTEGSSHWTAKASRRWRECSSRGASCTPPCTSTRRSALRRRCSPVPWNGPMHQSRTSRRWSTTSCSTGSCITDLSSGTSRCG